MNERSEAPRMGRTGPRSELPDHRTATVRVEPLAPADEPRWDAYVHAHDRGTLFHLLGWRNAVRSVFPFEPLYLTARDADGAALRGLCPLFHVRNPLARRRSLLSIPFAVYGGILADDDGIAQALLDAARRLAVEHHAGYVELRSREETGFDLPVKDLYVTFVRDLPDDPAECLARLPRKARAAARHSIKRHGLTAEWSRDRFDEFYRLFVLNKRDLGSPALPARFLAALLREFGPQADILCIRKDAEMVAAVLTFFHGRTVVPYYSGSLARASVFHPSNFMYLRLQELAVERGCRSFDFGRSRRDTGAFDFKKNQGFTPTPLHYQYLILDDREVPDVQPGNPRFDLARTTWQRLPYPVARWLGPAVSRYSP